MISVHGWINWATPTRMKPPTRSTGYFCRVRAPITNYGVAISHIHGVLERALSPFANRVG
ncbi:hypothetical protein [Spirochaeta africana]|uniref:hypothetical protein n=1 Tax=Spirochaeta africana TaxID=46355 RepID=UPI00145F0C3E